MPATAWSNAFSAAYYHFANRDPLFTDTPIAYERFLRRRLAEARQPPIYKSYPKAPAIALADAWEALGRAPLADVLRSRRTNREFLRRPVSFAAFSALLRGTWGQTGWIDGGFLGKLIGKTSPSAGARHPVECYALVQRVDGVPPGLYHYAVKSNRIERLRAGDPSSDTVRLVADCGFLRDAAFVCVMSAVVARLFWKYPSAGAYRLLFLDAGHLAQTFSLIATGLGLGPFTTAALRHSRIERLLGLDGVSEFPLYVCAAGVPAARLLSPRESRPVQNDVQRRHRFLAGRDDEKLLSRRGPRVETEIARRRP